MNLFDRALSLEWPQRFSVQQFIIFVCTHASQAVLAEIIFTRLALGYTGNGGGFTHYPPGRSNDSARWYDTDEWESWYEWTAKTCCIDENHKKEKMLWEANDEERAMILASLHKTQLPQVEEGEISFANPELAKARLETMTHDELNELRLDLDAQLEKQQQEEDKEEEEQFRELTAVMHVMKDWACRLEEGEAGLDI